MFNQRHILTTAICVTALLGGTYTSTSIAATANGSAQAIVVQPLTLVETTTMDFGTVAGAGNITITPGSGTATVTGTATSSGVTPAQFTVTADALASYTVSFVSGIISDGSNLINVASISSNASGVGTGAAELFDVGATIGLVGTEPSGTYNTTNAGGVQYQVTVNY